MSGCTDSGLHQCVEIRVLDQLDPPAFDPPLLDVPNGLIIRFEFDWTYSRRDSRIVQAANSSSPCTQPAGGWTTEVDRDRSRKFHYIKWDNGSSFFYGQRYSDIGTGEPNKACWEGFVGGNKLSLESLNQYRSVLGLSATTTAPVSTATQSSSDYPGKDSKLVQVALPIIFGSLVFLFGLFALIRVFLKRRATRRLQRLADADAEETHPRDSIESRGTSNSDVTNGDEERPLQTTEHMLQENNRLVMRVASVSSLPRYSPPPPRVPSLPTSPPPVNHFVSPEDDEARDEVPLMMSERPDRTTMHSPTHTVTSEDTLPEYTSMVSGPPSSLSRMAPPETTGGILATLRPFH